MTGPKPLTKKEAVEKALKTAKQRDDCLIREDKAGPGGYKVIGALGRQFYAHRLVYEVFNHKPEKGLVVRHTCDNKDCINPEHLILGTHADNVKDKVERKRHGFGEKHYASRMTEDFVRTLRSFAKPVNFVSLSMETGISVGALKAAYYGHTWKHV